jgi:hypothetical protein
MPSVFPFRNSTIVRTLQNLICVSRVCLVLRSRSAGPAVGSPARKGVGIRCMDPCSSRGMSPGKNPHAPLGPWMAAGKKCTGDRDFPKKREMSRSVVSGRPCCRKDRENSSRPVHLPGTDVAIRESGRDDPDRMAGITASKISASLPPAVPPASSRSALLMRFGLLRFRGQQRAATRSRGAPRLTRPHPS